MNQPLNGTRRVLMGIGALLLSGACLFFVISGSEQQVQSAHGRGAGTMRLLDSLIGVTGLKVLAGLFALVMLWYLIKLMRGDLAGDRK
jgi:tetrahydromethanopterin S-methyltransferase subunit D